MQYALCEMENFIGLEVLFAASYVRSKYDALVCVLHWCMLQNECKCKGLASDSVDDCIVEKLSELLPSGWNKDNDLYSLLYQRNGSEDFILKILRVEETLLVNVQRLKDDKLSSWTFETGDFVTESTDWSFEGTYKNLNKLRKQFEDCLAQIFDKQNKTEKLKQECRSRLMDDSEHRNTLEGRYHRPQQSHHRQYDPFSVGVSDLDPFSSGSSGMLMDPARSGFGIQPLPNRLPRRPGIPGARFDPVGPGMTFQTPNPDHLPPPGFDDMYT